MIKVRFLPGLKLESPLEHGLITSVIILPRPGAVANNPDQPMYENGNRTITQYYHSCHVG